MATSGEDARPAVAGSSELGPAAAAAGPGGGQPAPLHSLDYPCTARLRIRRLLGYLRHHSYAGVYLAARGIMPVVFHARDLAKNVKAGKWRDAVVYVVRFAPFDQSSYEARLLVLFLQDLSTLNDFANGHLNAASYLCDWLTSIYRTPLLASYPCFAALVDDVLYMRSDRASSFLDWQLVRNKAAKIAEEMAYKTPELRGKMHYPRGRNNLYHVAPLGSRHFVKNTGKKQTDELLRFYLKMKKSLPSKGEVECPSDSVRARMRGEELIALLERALEAGRCSVLKQDHIPKHVPKEDFPLVQATRVHFMPMRGASGTLAVVAAPGTN